MRKVLIVLGVILLLIGISAAVVLKIAVKQPKEKIAIESIVPTGAVVYLRADEIEKNIEGFTQTQLFKQLAELPIADAMEKLGAAVDQIKQFEEVKKQVSDISQNVMLKKFFAQEIAVVVYPFDVANFDSKELDKLLSSLVVVTRLAPEAQLAEFAAGFVSSFGEDVRSESSEYNDYTITHIIFEEGASGIYYARYEHFLLLSLGEDRIKQSIDVWGGKKASLKTDDQFIATGKRFLGDADIIGYGNVQSFAVLMKNAAMRFADTMKELNEDQKAAAEKQLSQGFKQLDGLNTFGASAAFGEDGEVSQYRFGLFFDKKKISDSLQKIYSCSSQDNKSLSFVPNTAVLYQWNNCHDFASYWDQIREAIASKQEGSAQEEDSLGVISKIEETLNASIQDDIIPLLADEAGGYLTDVSLTNMFPIPQFVLFLEVTDRQKAQELLGNISDNSIVVLQNEEFDGTEIKYLSLPIGLDLQPGYCFVNNYLLVSSSKKLLEQSIEAQSDKTKSLQSVPDFMKVGGGFVSNTNGLFYVKISDLIRKSKKLVGWANQFYTGRVAQTKAFYEGAQKRLVDIESTIETIQSELSELKMAASEKKQVAQADPAADRAELDALEMQIKLKENELLAAHDKKLEATKIVKGYEQGSAQIDPQQRQVFIDEVVMPLLEASESIKEFIANTEISDSFVETTTAIRIE